MPKGGGGGGKGDKGDGSTASLWICVQSGFGLSGVLL